MHSVYIYLKRNSEQWIPFSEENTKGIQNDGFLFPFSEESTNGIQNDGFLFICNFTWKHLNLYMMIACCEHHSSMLSYFTDHASSPRPPLPPLFSFTISEKH